MIRLGGFLLALLVSANAYAGEIIHGPVAADFISCYDGDTCTFDVQVWPAITVHTAVRLRGIDTPEIRGACASEKERAVLARDALTAFLTMPGTVIVLTNVEPDKYGGRVLADVLLDGQDASALLIAADLGRAYHGGKREGWCGEIAAAQ